MDTPDPSPQPDRREFIKKAAAVAIGGTLVVAPITAGLFVFMDPLGRKSGNGASVLVATLSSLPENGEPRKFSVLATKVDAWNRTPNVPVGAVYLQRLKENTVRALNVVCPMPVASSIIARPTAITSARVTTAALPSTEPCSIQRAPVRVVLTNCPWRFATETKSG